MLWMPRYDTARTHSFAEPVLPLSIDVISDVVCPWCYIGKRRLEEALVLWREGHPGEEPEVRWHPFELNPDMPAGGMDRRIYLEDKFGGPERAREIYARVEAAGREVGIPFDFSRIRVQPNTSNAHRLIAWAGALGNQTSMVEALFQGYFLEARNFADEEILVEVAGAAGFDRSEASELLASDELREHVRTEERQAQRLGVSGVPFFIFNQKLAVSGAQPAEVLVEAMEESALDDADAEQ
jgi:predicted DsbA family dithiol-disulfide isomerase